MAPRRGQNWFKGDLTNHVEGSGSHGPRQRVEVSPYGDMDCTAFDTLAAMAPGRR